ncbi:unnamed protein product [Phaedon cochleariae]|uniref:Aromatic amino acid beta-eliminating lyase/threonine aldolase domain-containing protein n=1 Tax=Phaedon cochleariae TaxID=80249 RepID=A0A9P0DCA9_PHACE|nr:unnamed protein product [Phaedon cochleariae]
MYEKIVKTELGDDVKIIDLRTDTISRPTQEMREAMFVAEVGDDVYGEDPTVADLERASAELLGKEDAVFLASGTMANLIAVMVHCSHRGSEILVGDKSHIFRLEQGGAAQIAGVQCQPMKNKDDGTFSLDELREKIRKNPDIHEPISSLIVIENTHNLCGGKVLPLDWIEKVGSIGSDNNIAVHMDGARLFNAAIHLKVMPKRVVRDVDSVCFCISKGLGCPVGAVLVGNTDFITRARRIRKVLGGGWRQAGVLAAAGLVALNTMINRLRIDHEHAYRIAKAISDFKSDLIKVDLPSVQTNIVMININLPYSETRKFVMRLAEVRESDPVKVKIKIGMRQDGKGGGFVRLVTQWEVTSEDVNLAISKIGLVVEEFESRISSKL